ncbi:MAG: family 16 glycosylhydrolase [Planctomycetota bacterium]
MKLATLAAAATVLSAPIAHAQFSLVFEDEFDGTGLNTQNWTPLVGDGCNISPDLCGWGNNELQYYTGRPENVEVSDGTLKIIARREAFGGRQYTSARLVTRGKQDYRYGRFEASLKLPSTPGIWPAFWMLPTNSPYGGWAASGEIDIMESVNFADRLYTTIHYGGFSPGNTSTGTSLIPGPDLSQDFHVYAIEWSPDVLRWYFDDQLVYTLPSSAWFSSSAPSNPRAPFDHPFHLLLNVAVGGNFPGNPTGASQFPQTMEVDWVRIHRWVQEPFSGIPAAVPGVIQAEEFDFGGDSVAYVDSNPATNNGGQFRPNEGVDIEDTIGGFNVGWIGAGERLEYTVNVAQAGVYTASFRTASPAGGGAIRLLTGSGIDLSGEVPVEATGGWQNWGTTEASITLTAGEQVLVIENAGAADRFNLDLVTFAFTTDGCGVADTTTSGVNPGGTGYGLPDGNVDVSDITYYVERWLNGEVDADVTTSGTNPGDAGYGEPDNGINTADLTFFVERWLAGCA